MRVSLDGETIEIPSPVNLGELMDGIGPRLDPTRLVTRVEVDGAPADASDRAALLGWRLAGAEAVTVVTEAPAEFAAARRREIPGHLRRIADLLTMVAHGIATGAETDANRVLAAAAHELGLVLELDRRLSALASTPSSCEAVAETVRRIGPQLTDAERGRRWQEVAQLLSDELVPVLRAGAE
jgi:hypothetical protein